ncbi:MAG: hypothetical protein H5T83_05250 [Actinotalea sp.]|nr:hypothetical protein [Actinotalea sp.]
MTRLRATAALAAALLLPLAACAAPDDAARPQARLERESPAGTAADDPRPGTPREPSPSSVPGDRADLVPTAEEAPGAPWDRPVDAALGPGLDLTGLVAPDELLRATRTDPTPEGADGTALLFAAAWSTAVQTGDGAPVLALSAPTCAFCASVAASAEGVPLSADLELVTTVWPVTTLDPTQTYPYRVAVLGLEHLVVRVGSIGEVLHVETVSARRQLVHVAVDQVDGLWTVHGVSAQEWDGRNPLLS